MNYDPQILVDLSFTLCNLVFHLLHQSDLFSFSFKKNIEKREVDFELHRIYWFLIINILFYIDILISIWLGKHFLYLVPIVTIFMIYFVLNQHIISNFPAMVNSHNYYINFISTINIF